MIKFASMKKLAFMLFFCLFASCKFQNDTDDFSIEAFLDEANNYTGRCTTYTKSGDAENLEGTVSFYGYLQCYNAATSTTIWAAQYKFKTSDKAITFSEEAPYVQGASGYSSTDDIPYKFIFEKSNGTTITITKMF